MPFLDDIIGRTLLEQMGIACGHRAVSHFLPSWVSGRSVIFVGPRFPAPCRVGRGNRRQQLLGMDGRGLSSNCIVSPDSTARPKHNTIIGPPILVGGRRSCVIISDEMSYLSQKSIGC